MVPNLSFLYLVMNHVFFCQALTTVLDIVVRVFT